MCLPRGIEIIKGTGSYWKTYGSFPTPIHLIVDDIQRDKDTATALLEGLELPSSVATVSAAPFNSAPGCPKLSTDSEAKFIREKMEETQKPKDWEELFNLLQNITGRGSAPPLSLIDDVINGGYLNGRSCYAADFAENFLLQFGGGMKLGWGKLSPFDLYRILSLRSYDRLCSKVVPGIQAYRGASIAAAVLRSLQQNGNGTAIYVGHDSDMWSLAAILNLTWEAPP